MNARRRTSDVTFSDGSLYRWEKEHLLSPSSP